MGGVRGRLRIVPVEPLVVGPNDTQLVRVEEVDEILGWPLGYKKRPLLVFDESGVIQDLSQASSHMHPAGTGLCLDQLARCRLEEVREQRPPFRECD